MSSQMTVQKIEQQIEQEYASFQNSPWMGSIPKDLVANFKSILMEIPPMKHQIHVKVIRGILKKEKASETLTYIEVGLIINCILNSPLYLLSDDLDTALTKLERLEKLRHEYNSSAKEKETQLLQRKQTMIQLATPASGNGAMRSIIN